jgi:hypothetical protein
MYKGGSGSGTSRGVVVVDKGGNVKVWFQGGVSYFSWDLSCLTVVGGFSCVLGDLSFFRGRRFLLLPCYDPMPTFAFSSQILTVPSSRIASLTIPTHSRKKPSTPSSNMSATVAP